VIDDRLTRQLRNIVDANLKTAAARVAAIAAKEAEGYRIVDGGPAITDWRTGETLFAGADTSDDDDYEARAAAAETASGGPWWHIDHIDEDSDLVDPVCEPGIPGSLAEVLADWLCEATGKEVTALIGSVPAGGKGC
jgi:hypothetical protein